MEFCDRFGRHFLIHGNDSSGHAHHYLSGLFGLRAAQEHRARGRGWSRDSSEKGPDVGYDGSDTCFRKLLQIQSLQCRTAPVVCARKDDIQTVLLCVKRQRLSIRETLAGVRRIRFWGFGEKMATAGKGGFCDRDHHQCGSDEDRGAPGRRGGESSGVRSTSFFPSSSRDGAR